jgi:hypothetical protein
MIANGEMTMSTAAMSRVNSAGISIELTLEDLQGTVGGLGSDGSKDRVGDHKSWRCGSQETHGRKSIKKIEGHGVGILQIC